MRVLKIIVTIFFLMTKVIFGETAPANTDIGAQAVVTYTKISGERVLSASNPVMTTVNEVVKFNLVGLLGEVSSDPSGKISIPYRLDNTGNIDDEYTLGFVNGDSFQSGDFFLDPEGRNPLEKIDSTTYRTPRIPYGEGIDIYYLGQLKDSVESNEIDVDLKVTSDRKGTLIEDTPTKIFVQSRGDAKIKKTIIYDENKKTFYFVFKFYNGISGTLRDIELDDVIDSNFIITDYVGEWIPFNSDEKKAVTFFLDGPEENAPEVDISLINNILKMKLNEIPENTRETSEGGELFIPFRVNPTLPENTILRNMGTYTFALGSGRSDTFNTTEAFYRVPYYPNTEVKGDFIIKDLSSTGTSNKVTFINTIKNTGNSVDTFNVNLAQKLFPEIGTTYRLVGVVGSVKAELTDSNGDDIPDTGPINPGETFTIELEVTVDQSRIRKELLYSVNKVYVSVKNSAYIVSVTDAVKGEITEKDISFSKFQGVDRDGDGKVDSYTTKDLEFIEGETIYYRLILTNIRDNLTIPNIIISDKIPVNTTYIENSGKYYLNDVLVPEGLVIKDGELSLTVDLPPSGKITLDFEVQALQ
ncbi:conserved repeat domain-containing protein [Cetobacterium ceti]|uniref:Conserved repeat domain-containing protein n=1 Tax=Cetobacterium ceti TaxID=180163 RepID=A0A1T4QGI7_9FUSO|nr:hypothetical protein [Cetobacterium ceti]SKA02829.1 conserved repeat domain-containing protein [Cetobacterium ceti]